MKKKHQQGKQPGQPRKTQFYYAVAVGRKPGVYNTWAECKKQTDGFSNPKFKKFKDIELAVRFANGEEPMLENGLQEHDLVLFTAAYPGGQYGICAAYQNQFALQSGIVSDPHYMGYNAAVVSQMFALVQTLQWGQTIALSKGIQKVYIYTLNPQAILYMARSDKARQFEAVGEEFRNDIAALELKIDFSVREWSADSQNNFYMNRAKRAARAHIATTMEANKHQRIEMDLIHHG